MGFGGFRWDYLGITRKPHLTEQGYINSLKYSSKNTVKATIYAI